MATLNVGIARGKEEMVEVMKERKMMILGMCETQIQENIDNGLHGITD